jgi:hypothetical protein
MVRNKVLGHVRTLGHPNPVAPAGMALHEWFEIIVFILHHPELARTVVNVLAAGLYFGRPLRT